MDYFEPQYHLLEKNLEEDGLARFGPMSSFTWNSDPKRLLFVLSRYKFAARMLQGCNRVIEIGCGDGFGSRIVKQHVDELLLTDIDPKMVGEAMRLINRSFPVEVVAHDFIKGTLTDRGVFDGAYLIDVLEHINPAQEESFFININNCLASNAKVVIGMPSIESQAYASPGSRAGHINCKTQQELGSTVSRYFETAFLFGMNDEVMHTGFTPMLNYIFAVCSHPRPYK